MDRLAPHRRHRFPFPYRGVLRSRFCSSIAGDEADCKAACTAAVPPRSPQSRLIKTSLASVTLCGRRLALFFCPFIEKERGRQSEEVEKQQNTEGPAKAGQ